jgi:hypothetical protein
MDTSIPQWFDPMQFPPLAIYYGEEDYLVDAESFLERLEKKEQVRLLRAVKLEYEASQCGIFHAFKFTDDTISIVIFIWLVSGRSSSI